MTMRKTEKKTAIIGVRHYPAIKKKLQKKAEKMGLSLSGYISVLFTKEANKK